MVESGRTFDRLQQAVDSIGDGRGTIAIAPGRHADCAVQTAGVVSYLAAEPGAARLAPGVERDTTFVADWSGEALALGENALGPGLKRFEKR